MLSNELIKKIEEFVYAKPRSIQEISEHIGKNWRTADRYVEEISKEYGTISSRVFRGGTRGALKIVYWASMEKASSSVFQEQLEEQIMRARKKEDFSAFDIFQHVAENKKSVQVQTDSTEQKVAYSKIKSLYGQAQKQLLIFSGNLSFINFRQKDNRLFDVLDVLVKRGISLKIICRVDIAGRKNVEDVLSLNMKYGKEMVEIRHREHPLRATIIDKQCFDIKEIKEPTGLSQELDRKLFIFYNIRDKDWIEWMSRIFWKLFSSSMDARKRLIELDKLKSKNP